MHQPNFWLRNLGVSVDRGLPGLVDSGFLIASDVLGTVSQLVRQPGENVEWGLDVASKGLNVISSLSKTYSDELMRHMFNDFLRSWLLSINAMNLRKAQEKTV
jgi:hypothetical protein